MAALENNQSRSTICDATHNPLKIVDDWVRGTAASWVEQARAESYDHVRALNTRIGEVETTLNTAPITLGRALERNLVAGDRNKFNATFDQIKSLNATDRIEAVCIAVRANKADHKSAANPAVLPSLEVVLLAGGKNSLGLSVIEQHDKERD